LIAPNYARAARCVNGRGHDTPPGNFAADGGLAIFLHVGSPRSKEGDDRKEAKLDAILRKFDPENADETISRLDAEYQRR